MLILKAKKLIFWFQGPLSHVSLTLDSIEINSESNIACVLVRRAADRNLSGRCVRRQQTRGCTLALGQSHDCCFRSTRSHSDTDVRSSSEDPSFQQHRGNALMSLSRRSNPPQPDWVARSAAWLDLITAKMRLKRTILSI